MRFLFCGDQSLPEWFLSQLELLSNLSFVKLRKIGTLYVTVLTEPEERAAALEQIEEILTSSDFKEAQVKTIVAMIDFIITNAAKNNVEQEQLLKELVDLGIPKENCTSLCKILEQHVDKLRAALRKDLLRLNVFDDVTCKKWQVLRTSSSSSGKQSAGHTGEYADISISTSNSKLQQQGNTISFTCEKQQLEKLTEEMSSILKLLHGGTD